MGASHNAFVPAAILLENPGITLNEFDERIRQIGPFRNYDSDMIGWRGVYDSSFDMANRFVTGPICIGMPIYTKSLEPHSKDPWEIRPLEIVSRLAEDKWLSPEYRVNKFLGCRFEEEHECKLHVFRKYMRGNKLVKMDSEPAYYYLNGERIQVPKNDTHSQKVFKILEVLDTGTEKVEGDERIYQRFKLGKIVPEYQQERFQSLEELTGAHPRFSLDKLFDFSQNSGDLAIGSPFFTSVRWTRKNGGYYLDTDYILKMKQLGRYDTLHADFIYTSIVLTAEAIKHKEWEMLEYCSGDERPGVMAQFLMAHPDSKARHDDELLLFYDCKDASLKDLNNSEWLRQRLLEPGRRGLTPEQHKREYELVCEEAPELIKRMEWRREYNRGAFRPVKEDKNELPF
jgi:hypothetical protein